MVKSILEGSSAWSCGFIKIGDCLMEVTTVHVPVSVSVSFFVSVSVPVCVLSMYVYKQVVSGKH
jgi:hypothetical protein